MDWIKEPYASQTIMYIKNNIRTRGEYLYTVFKCLNQSVALYTDRSKAVFLVSNNQ